MPDLCNSSSLSSTVTTVTVKPQSPSRQSSESTHSNSLKPSLNGTKLLINGFDTENSTGGGAAVKGLKRCRNGSCSSKRSFEELVKEWEEKKIQAGVPKSRCFIPFLHNAPKMAECLICYKFVNPGEKAVCSVRGCRGTYHSVCVEEKLGIPSSKKFKCPQHACFLCKQKQHWRCVRCTIASHEKCSPWPDKVLHDKNITGQAVCWRHPTDWRLDKKNAVPTDNIEEIFCRLPLPYIDEEFKSDLISEDLENEMAPDPYVHIKRNAYLVKKKRDNADRTGCTCSSTCSKDCVCRVQCISCTKACRCSEDCANRPFRKEKKIEVVKTQHCGLGVEAAEPINKGDFIIEYVGEVINDAMCEQRLWEMKYRGAKNFYMCEIRKDFIIDATFKGNSSRFLNHSCDPNCILEKWQVDGETRVGVFADRSIEVGEPLTYNYRFDLFGAEVKCKCGAFNCQGVLGTKKKTSRMDSCTRKVDLCWGAKRKRTFVRRAV